jgi:hypothetical protein
MRLISNEAGKRLFLGPVCGAAAFIGLVGMLLYWKSNRNVASHILSSESSFLQKVFSSTLTALAAFSFLFFLQASPSSLRFRVSLSHDGAESAQLCFNFSPRKTVV